MEDRIKGTNAGRQPMPREQRAKQFAPFDALSGLHERLARAIREHDEERSDESSTD